MNHKTFLPHGIRRLFPVSVQFLCLALALLIVSCSGTSSSAPQENTAATSRTVMMFGTVSRITLYDHATQENFDAALAALQAVDDLINRNREDSELGQVNARAGREPVSVSKELIDLLDVALHYASISDGAFDPTIGPLVDLWGIMTDHAHVPTEEEIQAVLPLVDWSLVEIDRVKNTVFLPLEGMSLDFGAIGKGYAADKVRDILAERGVESAIINLGGNVFVMGTKPDGTEWNIGLQDPFMERGEYFMTVRASDETVVISGPYERYFEQDGVIYHHLMDKRTGYPAATHITTAAVIGTSSAAADSLSTAVFVLGAEEGMELINSLEGVDAVLLDESGNVYLSDGLSTNPERWSILKEGYILSNFI